MLDDTPPQAYMQTKHSQTDTAHTSRKTNNNIRRQATTRKYTNHTTAITANALNNSTYSNQATTSENNGTRDTACNNKEKTEIKLVLQCDTKDR